MASSKQNKCNTCKIEVGCNNCNLFGVLNLLGNFLNEEPETVERILRRSNSIDRGEPLFQTGDSFKAVYAIKSGSFKTYSWSSDRKEQVIGFHFPGELLGLDSVRSLNYSCNAQALEPGNVCQLQFEDLDMLGDRLPQFQEQLIRVLSNQILMDQKQSLVLGRQRADERLAAFLIDLSNRFKARGLPFVEFQIAMSRQDIASYLGLALESISRQFTRLQEQGLLKVSGKLVTLTNLQALEEMIRTEVSNH
ncbi:MAG: helix-turn-helix domain-containing protein [Proteobacteria bacterium]|nr:helix-turn-helix domain-containing protein [Pseudomonadota bacterium]